MIVNSIDPIGVDVSTSPPPRWRTRRPQNVLAALANVDTPAVITTGAYEQAGIAREGDVQNKFQAMSQYTGAFVLGRILAYAGGSQEDGYQR